MRLVTIAVGVWSRPAIAQTVADSARQYRMSTEAFVYLSAAHDTLERVSVHRGTRNWVALRDSAFTRAAGAGSPRGTYAALDWALRTVDRHSHLDRPTHGAAGYMLAGHVGYLRVPEYTGATVPALADSLQRFVGRMAEGRACGWVVDLRGNGGGNMWPMFAGIGPLLGDTIAGAFLVHGVTVRWYYKGGVAGELLDGQPLRVILRSTLQPAPVLRERLAPVAVLTDSETVSSAEVIAVAFRGRPNSRSFGGPTAGLSTVVEPYRLSDGAVMSVTIGVYADRSGASYGGVVTPDELVDMAGSEIGTASDAVLLRAVGWLLEQPGCAAGR